VAAVSLEPGADGFGCDVGAGRAWDLVGARRLVADLFLQLSTAGLDVQEVGDEAVPEQRDLLKVLLVAFGHGDFSSLSAR
jgi:hypothetical protein